MNKICVVCKKEFECYDKPYKSTSHGSAMHQKTKRPSNAKTCSKKCSKEYVIECRKEYSKKLRKASKLS